MNSTEMQFIADQFSIPVDLIERAIHSGMIVPVSDKPPYRFSDTEIELWFGWGEPLAVAFRERLRRDAKNELLGDFYAPGKYVQKNEYILPFKECWFVIDGGCARNREGFITSFHYYMAPPTRWALDFVIIHPDDYFKCSSEMDNDSIFTFRMRRHQEMGKPDYHDTKPWSKNQVFEILNPEAQNPQDHFCYEMDIIAPADGLILSRQGPGNDSRFHHIVKRARELGDDREVGFLIDHGNREISQFAHLLAREMMVRPGDQVEQGQLIGKAGAKHHHLPHLHWSVWDTWHPLFALGLPIMISSCEIWTDSSFVRQDNAWLTKGMLVRNGSGFHS